MLKKIFRLLDFFLPSQISDRVDLATHFRARSVVAAGLLGLFIVLFLFIGSTLLEVSLFIRIGMIFSFLALLSLIIFLKTRIQDFERSLDLGALVQISILFITIYMSTFSSSGMGFFGLIWLVPLFLLMAFYFKPIFGLLFFFINVTVLFIVSIIYHHAFFTPIQSLPDFKSIFMFNLFFVLISSYLISYLFIQLNGLLKEELTKQKKNLLESAKFQSLGQMASNLAHDINNPLFTIQGKLHQIRNLLSHDQLDLVKCDQVIEDVEGTILRLSQIVKGISTFARQEHCEQMEAISVDELVRGIVFLCSDRIVQSGITFDIKVAPEARVICYPSYISQVLINLLNNAIDALEHSEVKLIQIEAFSKNKWIEIILRDSGAGVNKEIESKMFESFFTTKKYGKGSGLGLSISKGLIEIHEGHLKYQRVGNMTEFIVYLPSYD